MEKSKLANYVEYTLLKNTATEKDIMRLCDKAMEYGFYGVCVHPKYVELARDLLGNSDIKVVTVIGFPLGENLPEIKCLEAKMAELSGADEVDMVACISEIKNGNDEYVYNEIMQVVNDVKIPVKVIIETSSLTDDEIINTAKLCEKAGAKFVKTSTGFAESGANEKVVKLIKSAVSNNMGIKASGGIKDFATAEKLIECGATRIGTSSLLGFDIK